MVSSRDAYAVFESGGLVATLLFVRDNGMSIHRDTLHSAMNVVSRQCGRVEPTDKKMAVYVESLSTLLRHDDGQVKESSLRCIATLADGFMRRGLDPAPIADGGLVDDLIQRLTAARVDASGSTGTAGDRASGSHAAAAVATTVTESGRSSVTLSISLLSILCRGSPPVSHVSRIYCSYTTSLILHFFSLC